MPYLVNWSNTLGWHSVLEQSVDTAGFARMRSEGDDLPFNPYIYQDVRGLSPLGPNGEGASATERNARSVDGLIYALSSGTHTHNSSVTMPFVAQEELENAVAWRLDDKIRNTELNLGVTMGEFGETAEFVHRSLTKTYKAYRQLRKGKVKGAVETLTGRRDISLRDIPGALADSWLAYAFGLRPIVNDVYDAVRVAQQGLLREPEPFIFNTHVRRLVDETWLGYPGSETISATLHCSGRVRVRIKNPTLYTHEQLGLTNPVEVAWELVPFSFVVDWFVPVGRWIQSVFPPAGLEFLDGYTYFKATGMTRYWTQFDAPKQGYEQEPAWSTSATTREELKHRKVLSGFPAPKFHVPDLSLSKAKVITAMALLYSLVENR